MDSLKDANIAFHEYRERNMSPRCRLVGRIAGYILLFVSTITFISGAVAPYWVTLQTGQHGGVWMSCRGKNNECEQFGILEIPVRIWQTLELLTLAMLVKACIICLVSDLCGIKVRTLSSATLAGFGGLLGFLVSVIFVALTVRAFNINNISYSWALYVATAGCVCAMTSSIITACNKAIPVTAPQVLSTPETGLVFSTNLAGGILVSSPYVTQSSLPLVTHPSSQNSHRQTLQYPSVMV